MSPGTLPPDPLYKYARQADAESMLERGSFMIGTLYGFRDEEKHGTEIGDAGEGTKHLTESVVDATWDEVRNSPIISSLIVASPGSDIRFSNTKFGQTFSVEDNYVFCVSRDRTKKALRDFGKDVCLRIATPVEFFGALTQSLLAAGKLPQQGGGFLSPCVYADRNEDYYNQSSVHPALLKPHRFSYQKEYRAVWKPKALPIEAVIISCPDAVKYLRLETL